MMRLLISSLALLLLTVPACSDAPPGPIADGESVLFNVARHNSPTSCNRCPDEPAPYCYIPTLTIDG
jgi:hypothetical protein